MGVRLTRMGWRQPCGEKCLCSSLQVAALGKGLFSAGPGSALTSFPWGEGCWAHGCPSTGRDTEWGGGLAEETYLDNKWEGVEFWMLRMKGSSTDRTRGVSTPPAASLLPAGVRSV